MKKGLVVFIIAGLVVGEWVNMNYQGGQPFVQKMVIRSDFVGEDWNKPTDIFIYYRKQR